MQYSCGVLTRTAMIFFFRLWFSFHLGKLQQMMQQQCFDDLFADILFAHRWTQIALNSDIIGNFKPQHGSRCHVLVMAYHWICCRTVFKDVIQKALALPTPSPDSLKGQRINNDYIYMYIYIYIIIWIDHDRQLIPSLVPVLVLSLLSFACHPFLLHSLTIVSICRLVSFSRTQQASSPKVASLLLALNEAGVFSERVRSGTRERYFCNFLTLQTLIIN